MFSCWGHALHTLVVLLAISFCVFARSSPPLPLVKIAHPATLALEILPRQAPPPKPLLHRDTSPFLNSSALYHSDAFRLTLVAFGETFYLHLQPNDHLIHPAARINYYKNGPDGQGQVLDRTVPLLRESIRAYWGEVIAAEHTGNRMREDAAHLISPRHPHRVTPAGMGVDGDAVERGWARILVHSEGNPSRGILPIFEGAFTVDGVTHHVQTRENYLRNRRIHDPDLLDIDPTSNPDAQLVIWRDSDLLREGVVHIDSPPRACSHDDHDYNTDPWWNPVLRKHTPASQPAAWYDSLRILRGSASWANNNRTGDLAKRDDVAGGSSSNNFSATIGNGNGCPKTQKVLYMGVAADCEYVSTYQSASNATTQIINNWNVASSIYKSAFNVSLGIVEINIQEPTCPTSPPSDAPWNIPCSSTSTTLNNRLSLFSSWRGSKGNDGLGLWHLMSGCPTGSEVGVAWLGTLCQQTATGQSGSFVSGTAVSTNGLTEWEVISHEIGHNFGAIHDCESTCASASSVCCPMSAGSCNANDQFIMSPITSSSQKVFSQCTVGNICSLMTPANSGGINATCLQDPNPNMKTLSLNMCGNGIVENGEDCDPGLNVTSTCCNSSTCKFLSGAVCDPTNSPCCTSQCQFSPSSTTCRPAVDPNCDIAEMCTGNSSACPKDQFKTNGQSCGSNGLACANGVCTSLNQQCQSAGMSLNLSTACTRRDSSCLVSCQDPSNSFQCLQLQTQVIDGSPCGFSGTCQDGVCRTGNVLDAAKAWYTQNPQIAIPVTVVAGIVALLLLCALCNCIRGCCRSRKRNVYMQQLPSRQAPYYTTYNIGRRSPKLSDTATVRDSIVPPFTPGSQAGVYQIASHRAGAASPNRNSDGMTLLNVYPGPGTRPVSMSSRSYNSQSSHPTVTHSHPDTRHSSMTLGPHSGAQPYAPAMLRH